MVAAAGWWVAIVELVPASARPYIGGSQTNSVLELTLGYNGLGRITGDEVGSVGGGGGQGGGWGETGLLRLFNAENGGQIAWLLPAALILLVAGLAGERPSRPDRPDPGRVPAVGRLAGRHRAHVQPHGRHLPRVLRRRPRPGHRRAGRHRRGVLMWRRRRPRRARWCSPAPSRLTAVWSWVLLGRSADWQPWLRPVVLTVGLAATALLTLSVLRPRAPGGGDGVAGGRRRGAGLAGPAAYALDTAATPHTWSRFRAPGRRSPAAGRVGAVDRAAPPVAPASAPPAGRGRPGRAGQPAPGRRGRAGHRAHGAAPPDWRAGRPGGMGGLLNAQTPDAELIATLTAGCRRVHLGRGGGRLEQRGRLPARHPAAGHADRRLQRQRPAPTLAQFQRYVAEGQIHYFIGGGGFGPTAAASPAVRSPTGWPRRSPPRPSSGVTLYDLSDVTDARHDQPRPSPRASPATAADAGVARRSTW